MSSIDPYGFLRGFLGKRSRPHPSRLRRAAYALLCNCHWQLFNIRCAEHHPSRGILGKGHISVRYIMV